MSFFLKIMHNRFLFFEIYINNLILGVCSERAGKWAGKFTKFLCSVTSWKLKLIIPRADQLHPPTPSRNVSQKTNAPKPYFKLGKHESYMPSLQRLCFLRRSVAGLTYIRFRPYCGALIGPSPKKLIIIATSHYKDAKISLGDRLITFQVLHVVYKA